MGHAATDSGVGRYLIRLRFNGGQEGEDFRPPA
jgi:hypothetical protein